MNNLTSSQAAQNANCVRRVGKALDPHKKLSPCVLQNPDKNDDFWFSPHLKNVIAYSKLPLDERLLHLAATTLQSWLANVKQFLTFLMTRKIYIEIGYNFNEKKR